MADAGTPAGFDAYDEHFYSGQAPQSRIAAGHYAACLAAVHRPQSVLDAGCGRGTWLSAFAEQGATRLVGLDGPWNTQGAMIDQAIEFRPTDLARLTPEDLRGERFDLAISVEVAEHLPPGTERGFAASLAAAADVILFGAAIPHQTGTHHVNLRWQSAWGRDFAALGYAAYDLFRPALWGHAEVPYWYQQNSFLYVRHGHEVANALAAAGCAPVERLETLDTVHPALLCQYAEMPAGRTARKLAKQVLPERVFAALKALRG